MRILIVLLGTCLILGSAAWFFSGEQREAAVVVEELAPSVAVAEKPSPPSSPSPPPFSESKSAPPATKNTEPEFVSHAPPLPGQKAEPAAFRASSAPQLEEKNLLRDNVGNPLLLSQDGAMKLCAKRGMHLPTMRELALFAQSRGANGIMEWKDVDPGARVENLRWSHSPDNSELNRYYLVRVIDPNGKEDVFYYGPNNYSRPNGEVGDYLFLSSSRNSKGAAHSFGINARNGVLGGENEKSYAGEELEYRPKPGYAVCVPGPQ